MKQLQEVLIKRFEDCDEDIELPIRRITTEIIREYLKQYQIKNNCSKITIDNVRRNLSSFFSWLEEENYILKNPIRRIHKVKIRKTIKKVISDENIEIMRDGELVNLDISNINFEERECIVYGKGDKERRVYFGVVGACLMTFSIG